MKDIFYDNSQTVTIFNHVADDGVLSDDNWYVTLLKNVRIVETQGKNISTSGLENADAVKVHIMLDNLEKPYLGPVEWSELLDKTEAFTLTGGRDFLVIGDVSDIEAEVPDLFQYCKENYDGVYRITHVDKFMIIPHLEVGGR